MHWVWVASMVRPARIRGYRLRLTWSVLVCVLLDSREQTVKPVVALVARTVRPVKTEEPPVFRLSKTLVSAPVWTVSRERIVQPFSLVQMDWMGSPVRIMELLLWTRVRIPVSVNVLMGTLGLIVKQGLRLALAELMVKLVKMEDYHNTK